MYSSCTKGWIHRFQFSWHMCHTCVTHVFTVVLEFLEGFRYILSIYNINKTVLFSSLDNARIHTPEGPMFNTPGTHWFVCHECVTHVSWNMCNTCVIHVLTFFWPWCVMNVSWMCQEMGACVMHEYCSGTITEGGNSLATISHHCLLVGNTLHDSEWGGTSLLCWYTGLSRLNINIICMVTHGVCHECVTNTCVTHVFRLFLVV